ncbi:MAG: hypothetical protein J3Q66DRAFT_402320 [Benniella sp.]|nr:MAG: hypothetical protein J3Q66DRAFT_402320 [Benniella sp.]
MDKFKEHLAALHEEINDANGREKKADDEARKLQEELIAKDYEIISLRNRIRHLQGELDKT